LNGAGNPYRYNGKLERSGSPDFLIGGAANLPAGGRTFFGLV